MKIVIVGAGEVGFHTASRLAMESKDVVVVDTDPKSLKRVSEHLDVAVVEGSGASPQVLAEAGVESAEILLAVTDSDEINLVSCLFTDLMSPATKKLIRIRDADYTDFAAKLRENPPHIDTIINPELEMSRFIVRLLEEPGAEDVAVFGGGRVRLVGVRVAPLSRLAGVRMKDLLANTGGRKLLIAAIVREEKLIIPSGRDTILQNDLVYFLAPAEDGFQPMELFGRSTRVIRRVLIVGGGRAGLRLSREISGLGLHVKLVEKDPQRCSFLAEALDKVVVLSGDGSDQELLTEENVADQDVVVTLTGDEETNILASLLVKRMGVAKAITRIDKFHYFPLMQAIGIEHVVSARMAAINSILQHVRRGKVISSVTLKGESGEVMEVVALETSGLVGKPIRDLSFPKGALIIAILRDGRVIVPTGDSVIEPRDRVVIIATSQAVPLVERALSVRLEYF
ncbi:MAG: Trk system potassium transporter TrkA [Thermodesulfobacteriota bacterium]